MVRSGYNASMSSRTREYMEAIEHLPDRATLVLHESNWSEYERLLEDLINRPRLRLTYNRGKLEIMSPLSESASASNSKNSAEPHGKNSNWIRESNRTVVIT